MVSPVGIYRDRVLKGIKWLRPAWIFLVVNSGSEEEDPWIRATNEYAEEIKAKISFFYGENSRIVPCDYKNHESFFRDLNELVIRIIPQIIKPSEIWIDLTSVPEIQEVALLFLAAIHKNVHVFYTTPDRLPTPSDYPEAERDPGGKTFELPVIKSMSFDEIAKGKHGEVLIELAKERKKGKEGIEGFSTLLKRIGFTKEKKDYMKLGRIIDDLKKCGMVLVERRNREKLVKLTMGGEMLSSSLMG